MYSVSAGSIAEHMASLAASTSAIDRGQGGRRIGDREGGLKGLEEAGQAEEQRLHQALAEENAKVARLASGV